MPKGLSLLAFLLENVVPWGRNLHEYREMFLLSDSDMEKKIAGFADGPASFNCEATAMGGDVTSIDVIYQFSAEQLRKRIEETKDIVLGQLQSNADNFNWANIKNVQELGDIRMAAMNQFLSDYDRGKEQGRYLFHEFPQKTTFADSCFDLGLCSHFLLLYPLLGLDFHIKVIDEMLRVCKELRISPAVDLDGNAPSFLPVLLSRYQRDYQVEIIETSYAFLKTENQFVKISRA